MAGYLATYGAGEEQRERLRKRLVLGAVILLVGTGVLYFYLKNYRQDQQVKKFFEDTSKPALQEWEEAVQQVRAGEVNAEWLIKRPAETELGVEVTLFAQPAATNNDLGEMALAA